MTDILNTLRAHPDAAVIISATTWVSGNEFQTETAITGFDIVDGATHLDTDLDNAVIDGALTAGEVADIIERAEDEEVFLFGAFKILGQAQHVCSSADEAVFVKDRNIVLFTTEFEFLAF